MKINWAVVTVVTRNYLHFARALTESIRKIHPDARIFVGLVDNPPTGFNPKLDAFDVVPFSALKIDASQRFLFQYSPFELTCALKSFFVDHIFETTDVQKVLYLDADIKVYGSLEPLLAALNSASILLTPHLCAPRSIETVDTWETDLLDTGIYNGGCFGVRNCKPGRMMLDWWRSRMLKLCKREINFEDQGWLNAVPALFDDVWIERGSGCNVAVWNLLNRPLTEDENGKVFVSGCPLVFFHFAGIDTTQTEKLSKVSRSPYAEEPALARRLYEEYIQRLRACGMDECVSWGYTFATLADGTRIEPAWRELIRAEDPELAGVEDPFRVPASRFRKVARARKLARTARRVKSFFQRL